MSLQALGHLPRSRQAQMRPAYITYRLNISKQYSLWLAMRTQDLQYQHALISGVLNVLIRYLTPECCCSFLFRQPVFNRPASGLRITNFDQHRKNRKISIDPMRFLWACTRFTLRQVETGVVRTIWAVVKLAVYYSSVSWRAVSSR